MITIKKYFVSFCVNCNKTFTVLLTIHQNTSRVQKRESKQRNSSHLSNSEKRQKLKVRV